ncbi:MAG: hypothetical protein ACRDK9_09485 [Solirubrobacterales bacterium]
MSESRPCPLCGRPLYGWIALPQATGAVRQAPPAAASRGGERVLERCESCGVGLERGHDPDLVAEWEAICRPGDDRGRSISVPNRASLQASLGGEGWAGLDSVAGRLVHTPASLELLAERNGHSLGRVGFPPMGRAQGWMWQTLLNGLTFHPNFAREARAGNLRPSTGRGRLAFAADLIVTVLAAPFVALVSFPMELVAVVVKRGGQLTASAYAAAAPATSKPD